MNEVLFAAATLAGLLFLVTADVSAETTPTVGALIETETVARHVSPWPLNIVRGKAEDDLDDAAIWVHASKPEDSMIIATDKNREDGGLRTYALDGSEIAFKPLGPMNNVSLRQGIPLDGGEIDLVAATNRQSKTVMFFRVDALTRALIPISGEPVRPTFRGEVYGICLYQNQRTDELFVFVTSTEGFFEQWGLERREGGQLDGWLVRSIEIGSQAEGCVADDEHGRVYVAEENVGIWRMQADPEVEPEMTLIDAVGRGRLEDDVEGLTLYKKGDDQGYLIASSQGNSSFAVYERTGDNAYVTSFEVVGADGQRVRNTDGIVATSRAVGEAFPRGLLVVHDNLGDRGGGSNFKLVPWDAVDSAIRLQADSTRQEPGRGGDR